MIGILPISCGVSNEQDILWLDFIKSCLGDFLGKTGTQMSEAETIAVARLFAGIQKISEALVYEALPGTSTDMLDNWAYRLNVPISSLDLRQTIRTLCEFKYKLNTGSSEFNIRKVVTDLLGDALTEIRFNYTHDGYLDPAPTYTYDALGNPYNYQGSFGLSPDDYQVSERAHVLLLVNQGIMSEDVFLRLIAIQLRKILELLLPTWAIWDWSISDDGFIIGPAGSRLGFVALKYMNS